MVSLISSRGLLGWGETTVFRGRPDRADIKGVAYGPEGTEGCHHGPACPGVAPGAWGLQGPNQSL